MALHCVEWTSCQPVSLLLHQLLNTSKYIRQHVMQTMGTIPLPASIANQNEQARVEVAVVKVFVIRLIIYYFIKCYKYAFVFFQFVLIKI